jgi:hypothetical protein
LTHAHGAGNYREIVAARLTKLIEPFGNVSAENNWMPQGFDNSKEVCLDKKNSIISLEKSKQLRDWWLAHSNMANTPNWDIASSCLVGKSGSEKPGILLVEAKAHKEELMNEEKGKGAPDPNSKRSCENHDQIGERIKLANKGLENATKETWNLSRDSHYQLSNRFAWSWKLLDLGVPVILVYLGFLNANEMPKPFIENKEWGKTLIDHSNGIVPSKIWNKQLEVNGQPFILLIRSIEIPLKCEND